MHTGRTIFSQLMDFFPLSAFRRCVDRYRGDYVDRYCGDYKVQSFSGARHRSANHAARRASQ